MQPFNSGFGGQYESFASNNSVDDAVTIHNTPDSTKVHKSTAEGSTIVTMVICLYFGCLWVSVL